MEGLRHSVYIRADGYNLLAARPIESAHQLCGSLGCIVSDVGRAGNDLEARRLSCVNGEELELTAMEFDLLAAFARNPNRVLSRERLLDLAHNHDTEPFDRSIDIRIARLRRKIERDPSKPLLIKTMRGAGYMFVPSGL
jgi:two-component system phosphate regulon response regulator OmpR